ncbi:MAG: glycoside hydrolase family 10 protein, partial [Bacteroidota bacterium]
YPYYPVNDEDSLTYLEHHNGIEDIEDWRRYNVNELVAQVHDSIQVIAPYVTYGISPFAVRKNTDAGTDAFEGYYRLYADGVAWLEQRTVDYINPQLYFELEHERAPYEPLMEYWARVARENERHMYAGLAPYRILPPNDWSLEQALDQLRLNLANENVQGNIFFRTEHLIANPKGYTDVLRKELYRYPALTPSLPWKSRDRPPSVDRLSASWSDDGRVILTWARPDPSRAAAMPAANENYAEAARYAVYRADMPSDQFSEMQSGLDKGDTGFPLSDTSFSPQNMINVTGQRQFVERWPGDRKHTVYIVTAVSHNSVESRPLTVWTWIDDDGFHYKVR